MEWHGILMLITTAVYSLLLRPWYGYRRQKTESRRVRESRIRPRTGDCAG
jgi:non-ribosomal peptide synthetase component F